MSVTDRVILLQQNDERLTGVAFVQVIRPTAAPDEDGNCPPTQLRIYFHTDTGNLVPPFVGGGAVPLVAGSIFIHAADGDPLVPRVDVLDDVPLVWTFDPESCRTYLTVEVDAPNDLRFYKVRIDDPRSPTRIDPFFNDVQFSFVPGCENDLDCAAPEPDCPIEDLVDFPVDYLARDFVSLRNALLDFAAQRYPEWTMPVEADVGTMLAETFAALGDEFSYVQDRYGREAYLETATERRSLRKKARLVDYDIHDGRAATTLLDFRVTVPTVNVATGTPVWALTESGPSVRFEVGLGLKDPKEDYPLREAWNRGARTPYWFDQSTKCLEVGATEFYVLGVIPGLTNTDLAAGDRLMLLATDPEDPSVPSRKHFVHLTEILATTDPLTTQIVTRLRWDVSDALPFQIDQGLLQVSLNIAPATAGESRCAEFACGLEDATFPVSQAAVERQGPLPSQLPGQSPVRPTTFLFSLAGTEESHLSFLGSSLRETEPEVLVEPLDGSPNWTYQRSLLESLGDEESFTLEDGTWREIAAYRYRGEDISHKDYASGNGYTLRFGDGVFGKEPARGTCFRVRYRVSSGALANVGADTITNFQLTSPPSECPDVPPSPTMPAGIAAVTNPWPVLDGANPESLKDIRQLTPEAYRADLFFAVKPEDYGTQAEKLDFIQRANGTMRWTGSWNTMFVAADPLGSFTMSDDEFAALEGWMNCVRQTGRDVIVKDPKFRTLDLEITICVAPASYPGQVAAMVREALLGKGGARPQKGFFDADNFSFGVPLRRSALEAAIGGVPGVLSVQSIRKREVGVLPFSTLNELVLDVAPDEVIRLENNASHPERGTLRLLTVGGN